MKHKINDTKKYFNQYHDVIDLPETPKYEPGRTCNITCIAMIRGKDPNKILQKFFKMYGVNNKFQWEGNLIKYLKDVGHECRAVTGLAWPIPRKVRKKELERMKKEIDEGKIIFYHKRGHYQLMVGYYSKGFIFNDPAGDRRLLLKDRSRESGHLVTYSYKKVRSERIFGRCWAVTI